MSFRTLRLAAAMMAAAGTLMAGATLAPTPAAAKKIIVVKAGHPHVHGRLLLGTGLALSSTVVVGPCAWLRERAYLTGRIYWWERYRACIEG